MSPGTLRCVVVDDEGPARQRLKRLVQPLSIEVVGEAGDGLSALAEIERLTPDLVFLDIEMPELDGLGVAAALSGKSPAIIFVTAYDEHAVRAFELAAVDYLVKPVSADRLAAAVARARARTEPPALQPLLARLGPTGPKRMAVRSGAKFVVFDPAQVSAIVARDRYAAILVEGKELLADDSLNLLETRFDPETFVRVHRAAIINVTFLKELVHEGDRRYEAVLTDSFATRVAVSRDRLPKLKRRLGLEGDAS